MIAVKPQYVETVLRDIKPVVKHSHVIMSIAAGISLKSIEKVRMILRPMCDVIQMSDSVDVIVFLFRMFRKELVS